MAIARRGRGSSCRCTRGPTRSRSLEARSGEIVDCRGSRGARGSSHHSSRSRSRRGVHRRWVYISIQHLLGISIVDDVPCVGEADAVDDGAHTAPHRARGGSVGLVASGADAGSGSSKGGGANVVVDGQSERGFRGLSCRSERHSREENWIREQECQWVSPPLSNATRVHSSIASPASRSAAARCLGFSTLRA